MVINEKKIQTYLGAFICMISMILLAYINNPISKLLMIFFIVFTILKHFYKVKYSLGQKNIILWFLFSLWSAYSLLWSAIEMRIDVVIVLLFIGFVALSVVLTANTKNKILIYLKMYVFSSVALELYMLSYYGVTTIFQERINNDVLNSNRAGIIFAYSALICLLLFDVLKNKLYIFMLAFLGFGVLVTGSKAAVGSLIIEIVVFEIVKSYHENGFKKIRNCGIMVVLLLVVFFLITKIPSLYNIIGKRLIDFLDNVFKGTTVISRSTLIRQELIEVAIERFLKRPLVGWGIGNFSYLNVYQTYAHSNLVELLADTGIIGAILFYANYIVIAIRSFRAENELTKAFAYAFLAASFFLCFCSVNFNEVNDIILIFLVAIYIRFNES